MIAPDDDRKRPCIQHRVYACLDVLVAFGGVGVDDVRVAQINNAHVRSQIGCVVFVVICATVAKAEQGGCLTHCTWAKPRARAKLRAKIIGGPKDSNVCVDLGPVRNVGAFAEG